MDAHALGYDRQIERGREVHEEVVAAGLWLLDDIPLVDVHVGFEYPVRAVVEHHHYGWDVVVGG